MAGYMAERLENIRQSGVEPGMTSLKRCRGRGGWHCLSADFGQEDSKRDKVQKNKYVWCVMGEGSVRSIHRLIVW